MSKKNNGGRPTIITELVLKKLEEVFSLGGTDKEACIFADISPQTLYNYQTAHPEFVERKELLKQQPILKARRKINEELENDTATARWYVERRDKDFNPKSEIAVEDNRKKDIPPEIVKKGETFDEWFATHFTE